MKRAFKQLAVILLFTSCGGGKVELQEGDILFQDLDCGDYCESIETVTQGVDGAELSHCGILYKTEQGDWEVLEAISQGVSSTPLDSFLNRSSDANGQPKVLVGRLKKEEKEVVKNAIEFAQLALGSSYDPIYDLTDDNYYCSELVYYSFLRNGNYIFEPKPMTFVDPSSKETFPVWSTYFNELGVAIPEGELGLNPGGISLSDEIEIVHVYGNPEGFQPTNR